MGPAPAEPSGLPPKQRKIKSYQVLGDLNEYHERLASTLAPPKAPQPPNVFTIQDTSEFPPEVWFAATISPDNGMAVIASFRELSKARALYQQQLNNIHTARNQHTLGCGGSSSGPLLQPLAPLGGSQATHISGNGSGNGNGSALVVGPSINLSGGPSSALSGEPPVNRTIAETLRMGAETRKLGKFEMQQQKWDEVSAALASKLGRAPQELAMQRGPAWRTRAELTELLYRAQPRDARGLNPDEAFLTSLRDAWERVIPLGSIFTGLALHIKEKPHELPDTRAARVGRPLDPLAAMNTSPSPLATLAQPLNLLEQLQVKQQQQQQQQQQAMQMQQAGAATGGSGGGGSSVLGGKPVLTRSLSARGRSWEDSEVLRQRVMEYGKRLRALAPYDPDFGALVVAGEALEGQLESLANAPITLAEVEAHMRTHDPAAYEAYRVVKDEMEAQFRAALEAEEAQRAAADAAARAAEPQPGPHVTASCSHLSLSCHTGERAHGSVTLTCIGTAAVWWRWERRTDPQPAHSATEVGQPLPFIASQQDGKLLPGQSLELSVTFVAPAAGTFRETWHLITSPPLQCPEGPSLALHLRGFAELRDKSATGRAAITSSLEQKEKMAKVAAAMERILRDVRMPRRPQHPESLDELAAVDEWDRANGCCADGGPYAWPPLFFSPAVQSELAEVYLEANAALKVAVTPPPEEESKKMRKGTAERHRKKPVDEPPPPPPKYPPVWDGFNITVLDELLSELSTVAQPVAAPLQARADAAKARTLVPPSGRRLLRRVMRSLVLKMVEGVEDKLGALRADMEAKAAAEGAGAAAAAVAAEEAAVAGDGHELVGGEGSMASVGTTATAVTQSHGGVKKEKAAGKGGSKGGSKGGAKGGVGASMDLSAATAAAAAAAARSAYLEQAMPAFHEKALSGTKSVVKASLNALLDEIHRHKVAVGDALEATIRILDEQIVVEQARLLHQQQEGGGESAVAAAVDVIDWYATPAGGVPAPSPPAPAMARSSTLEQLYWDRLCVLRTWTSLGIPTRADIR